MDEASDSFDVERAVAALIPDGSEVDVKAVLERELGLYLAAPDEKRRVVEERLRAINHLPKPKDRTLKDVIAVGAELGIQQANVYRLLKRIETYGPVTGLLPGHRTKAKTGAAKDGFGEPIDGLIAAAMRDQPDVTITRISKLLRSKAALAANSDQGGAFTVPGPALLRRRIHFLRGAGTTGMADARSLGKSILIDQCFVGAMVLFARGEDERPEARHASMTVIMDVPSSLILGIGVFAEKDSAGGLIAALDDLRNRVRDLAEVGLEVEESPSTIRWVIPDALVSAARAVVKIAEDFEPSVDLVAMTEKEAYPGLELYRHIGENLGPFRLQPRPSNIRRTDWSGSPASTEIALPGLVTAERSFAYEADQRNARRLSGMSETELSGQGKAQARGRAEGFSAALGRLFEPVVTANARDPHWSRAGSDQLAHPSADGLPVATDELVDDRPGRIDGCEGA